MAYALIASGGTALGANGGTSGALNTTGADLLIVWVSRYIGESGACTCTDSKGNTWTQGTIYSHTSHNRLSFFYAKNATVGTSHAVTIAGSTGQYSTCHFYAYSGSHLTAPLDQQNGAAGALVTGAITPSENNCLITTCLGSDGAGTGQAVDSSITLRLSTAYNSGVSEACYSGDKIQTTAAAITATWSTTAIFNTVGIASFKAAAASTNFRRTAFGNRIGSRAAA